MFARRIMLEKGFDTGTANLTCLIFIGICVVGYMIILNFLENVIIPLLKPLVMPLVRFFAKVFPMKKNPLHWSLKIITLFPMKMKQS